jgi:hypothetical protein
MIVPIVLGSDKTTVSVATGNSEYYISIGNAHNGLRRAHRNAVVVIAFLAIPKCHSVYYLMFVIMNDFLFAVDRVESSTQAFREFKHQLFHTSLTKILHTLKPGMATPEVVRCYDGHFRKAIYTIGPYIADYPEQVLVTCVVSTWCPRYVYAGLPCSTTNSSSQMCCIILKFRCRSPLAFVRACYPYCRYTRISGRVG